MADEYTTPREAVNAFAGLAGGVLTGAPGAGRFRRARRSAAPRRGSCLPFNSDRNAR